MLTCKVFEKGEVFFNGLKPEGIPNRTDTVEDDSSDKRRACFDWDLIIPTLCVGMIKRLRSPAGASALATRYL
jgi:hypothetical protein